MKRILLSFIFLIAFAVNGIAATYYPSTTCSNQAAATAGCTKAIVTAIGSAKNAKIIFRHTSGGNTTSYTFNSDVAVPAYAEVEVEPGAVLAGTGHLTGLKESYPEWFGAKVDNATDDQAAWQKAFDSIATTGGVVHVPTGTSYVATPIIWPNNGTDTAYSIRLVGNSPGPTSGAAPPSTTGGVSVIRYDGNGNLFDLRNGTDANLVWYGSIENVHLYGDAAATGTAIYAYAIKRGAIKNVQIKNFHGYGVSVADSIYYATLDNVGIMYCGTGFYAPAALVNGTTFFRMQFSDNDAVGLDLAYAGYPVNIEGCWFEDNGSYGLKATYVASLNITNSYFESNTTAHVYASSSTFYNTELNVIGSHFSADTDCYSLSLDRVSKLNVIGSRLESYDGSAAINFSGTIMTRGTMLGNSWPKVAGILPMAATHKGNFVWNDSKTGFGIHASSRLASTTVIPTGTIALNSAPESNGGQVGVVYTSPGAGDLADALAGVTADTTATSATITVNSNANIPIGSAVSIAGATFGAGSATYAVVVNLTGSTGVVLDSVVNETLTGAAVSWHAAEYKQIHGMVYDKSVSAVSTSGTGEDNLRSTVIPAGMMTTTSGFKVFASGTKAASNGNKTIKFYFGATSVTFHAAANNTNDWRFEATVYNLGAANSQGISWIGWDGATPLQGYDTAAIDTTAAVTMKITGECANGSDTITQTLWTVEPR